MNLRPSLLALFLIALASCSSRRAKVPRPAFELVAPRGCQAFRGEGKGNDALMNVELYLCTKDAGLKGEILLSGAESGWTVRALVGTVQSDGTLALRDTRIVEQGRAGGWTFCGDTEYSLTPAPDGSLRGGYTSKRCSDNASLHLLPQAVYSPPPPASTSVSP